jgi:DNA-binding SARP family transcriptional activator
MTTTMARAAVQEHSEAALPSLELQLLGGFAITENGGRIDVPEGSQRLLVYVALQERPQCRALVAGSLWPDKTDARAGANLRSSLWRLQSPHGRTLIDTSGQMLRLSDHVSVDVRRAESTGWALVHESSVALDDLDHRLFFLELLPGWYDDWVIMERERIGQLQSHFLEALSTAWLSRGQCAEALDVAVRLVSADPLRERSQRALIRVYCAEGSFGQARRQVARYRELMLDTFGCEPSPGIAAMIEESIRAH